MGELCCLPLANVVAASLHISLHNLLSSARRHLNVGLPFIVDDIKGGLDIVAKYLKECFMFDANLKEFECLDSALFLEGLAIVNARVAAEGIVDLRGRLCTAELFPGKPEALLLQQINWRPLRHCVLVRVLVGLRKELVRIDEVLMKFNYVGQKRQMLLAGRDKWRKRLQLKAEYIY